MQERRAKKEYILLKLIKRKCNPIEHYSLFGDEENKETVTHRKAGHHLIVSYNLKYTLGEIKSIKEADEKQYLLPLMILSGCS